MVDHVVEFLESEWQLVSAAVKAQSAFQAVIRAAEGEGNYRVRLRGEKVDRSEHFWVPAWGQPIAIETPPEPS